MNSELPQITSKCDVWQWACTKYDLLIKSSLYVPNLFIVRCSTFLHSMLNIKSKLNVRAATDFVFHRLMGQYTFFLYADLDIYNFSVKTKIKTLHPFNDVN